MTEVSKERTKRLLEWIENELVKNRSRFKVAESFIR